MDILWLSQYQPNKLKTHQPMLVFRQAQHFLVPAALYFSFWSFSRNFMMV